jgi:acyl-CoA synthetase (AMP-forming)/AMP-acid ligase II
VYPALRLVLFAGEVFPLPYLRRLVEVWPHPRYFNLYGPTETNVCTAFAVPSPLPPDRTVPFPIGTPCSGDRVRLVDDDGRDVGPGANGELWVAGGSVMAGYWNDPARTAAAFAVDADGARWYRTGDLVHADEHGELVYVARRDRMIKRRGYRIEPGEIESALHRHPRIVEAAVLAATDGAGEVAIEAHVCTRDGAPISLIELKRWCSEHLARYMIPDRFAFRESLPKTSTDKIDYRALQRRDG